MKQESYIEAPCKTCGKPIGNDTQVAGKWQKHYHDSSGREHKTCAQKRFLRKK